MAERRMFAKTIIDSDAFLDMPLSTQALYFHLSMRADDDGFLNNPKKIQRTVGCTDDDLRLLLAKNFIIAFENGVVVIKHWRIHNYIRTDRYKPTVYTEEMAQLAVKDNNAYTLNQPMDTVGIPNGYQMETQYRLGKDSIGKVSIDNTDKPKKHKYGEYQNVLLTDDELQKLKDRFPDYKERIDKLDKGIARKGYKYKSHYLAILKWAEKDAPAIKKEEAKSNAPTAEDMKHVQNVLNRIRGG